MRFLFVLSAVLCYAELLNVTAFVPRTRPFQSTTRPVHRTAELQHDKTRNKQHRHAESFATSRPAKANTALKMGLDLVTYLRTEWISAALCTNQTPRSADVCLQLGTEDGRAVTFIPRTIRELITSSCEKDGKLTLTARRQLKQQQSRRESFSATVTYVDQPADDLRETKDESVDVVISLQAAARMMENGQDWKRSVREAARVLKPGGRLLFVEQTELNGDSYLEYVENLTTLTGDDVEEEEEEDSDEEDDDDDESEEEEEERFPIFDDVGWDDVDLVLTPHVAGVAVKSMDAGMSAAERAQKAKQAEQERLAEISIEAYERGIKKRKRRKRKKKGSTADEETAASA